MSRWTKLVRKVEGKLEKVAAKIHDTAPDPVARVVFKAEEEAHHWVKNNPSAATAIAIAVITWGASGGFSAAGSGSSGAGAAAGEGAVAAGTSESAIGFSSSIMTSEEIAAGLGVEAAAVETGTFMTSTEIAASLGVDGAVTAGSGSFLSGAWAAIKESYPYALLSNALLGRAQQEVTAEINDLFGPRQQAQGFYSDTLDDGYSIEDSDTYGGPTYNVTQGASNPMTWIIALSIIGFLILIASQVRVKK